MMHGAYGIVMAGILLFPWSLVVVMLGGSAWQKAKALRHQGSRWRSARSEHGAMTSSLRSEGRTIAEAAACR
jgi:hypothetical protein